MSATVGSEVGDAVFDEFDGSRETTILALRNELNSTIKLILDKKQKAGFIFFIDDLDRIDPPIAVQILELLKNIFDLDKCIFVLAIDYDVVIKGLEPKFGKFTEANEREFRSFFDKIIQLPFSMPVATYDINSFLIKSLHDIGYITDDQAKDDEYISTLSEITRLTVGTNPRSLKRLLNSLSLISCVNDDDNESTEDEDDTANSDEALLVNYAIVNIQIAYPSVYMLLVKQPDFTMWDEKFAMEINLKELTAEIKDKLSQQDEFDEVWEQVLYRFCEKDFYLKSRVLLISQVLNSLRESLAGSGNIGEMIEQALSNSSVTNVAAFDKPIVAINASAFLKTLKQLLLPELNIALKGEVKANSTQKRIQKHVWVQLGKHKGKIDDRIRFSPSVNPKGIKISFYTERGIFVSESSNFENDIKKIGLESKISAIEKSINDFCEQHPNVNRSGSELKQNVWRYKKIWVVVIKLEITIKNAEELRSASTISDLTNSSVFLYRQLQELNAIYDEFMQ